MTQLLPQTGQRLGCLSVCGTRANRGILPGIGAEFQQRNHKGAVALVAG